MCSFAAATVPRARRSGQPSAANLVITTYGTAVNDMDQLSEFEWGKVVIDEAQAINPTAEVSQQLRRRARTRLALTGTDRERPRRPVVDHGLGKSRPARSPGTVHRPAHTGNEGQGGYGENVRALNGICRRTKTEPAMRKNFPIASTSSTSAMTPEQIGLYQAVDSLVVATSESEQGSNERKGAVLAALLR